MADQICEKEKYIYELYNGFDVQDVKHGQWIQIDDNKCRCSNCDTIAFIAVYPNGDKNFCPNCGAKMDGKEAVKKDYNPCNQCRHKGWDMPQCHYCNKVNDYKYRELDVEKFMESKNVPDRKESE